MNMTKWKEFAELTGILAIVLSLVFVGYELRQSRQVAFSELIANSNERRSSIREMIINNAETWKRACLGEPLDAESRIIAAKIWEAWKDHLGAEYILASEGVIQSSAERQRLIEEITAQLWAFPGILELQQAGESFNKVFIDTRSDTGFFIGMREAILERVEELKAKNYDWESWERDLAWCGLT